MYEDLIGPMSKEKIKDIIFDRLEYFGFKPTKVSVGNGYYIFDFGEDSVVHFNIKGIRGWRFAIWVQDSDDDNEYLVWLFGDKINWIDKFKPSASTVCSERLRIPKVYTEDSFKQYRSPDSVVFDISDILYRLKKNRHIAEYGLADTNESFVSWLWGEIKYYRIEKPLADFYENRIIPVLYKIALKILGLRYHRYVKVRDMVDQNKELGGRVYPRFRTGVEYRNGVDEDTKFNVWCSIEESRFVKFLNEYSHFIQYKDSNDKRGFYYKKKEKDEAGEEN